MPPQPKKLDLARTLLEQTSIFVHLDPRRPGVVVPAQFRTQPELVLQFGYDMRVPIPDLDLDEEFLTGTLSFARRPFWCRIPWSSVFAIVGEDKRGLIWPEDAPAESRILGVTAAPPEAKRSHLRAVGPSDAPPAAPDPDPEPSGEGECSVCAASWVEDALACPVCGSTREEAFVAKAAAALESAESSAEVPKESTGQSLIPTVPPELRSLKPVAAQPARAEDADDSKSEGDDDPPPSDPPKKRPHLRLVKS